MNKDIHFCPVCEKNGKKRIIKNYSLNLEETVSFCEEKQCLYPLVNSQKVYKFPLERNYLAAAKEEKRNECLRERLFTPESENKGKNDIYPSDENSVTENSISDMLDGFLLDCQNEELLEGFGKSDALLEIEQMLFKTLDTDVSNDSEDSGNKPKSAEEVSLPSICSNPQNENIVSENNEISIDPVSNLRSEVSSVLKNENSFDDYKKVVSDCEDLQKILQECDSSLKVEENEAIVISDYILKSSDLQTKAEENIITASENVDTPDKQPYTRLTSLNLTYPHLTNVDSLCWLDVSLMILIHNSNLRNVLLQIAKGKLLKLFKVYLQQLASLNKAIIKDITEGCVSQNDKINGYFNGDERDNLVTLEDERKNLAEFLQSKLSFQRGQEESPVFALPYLIAEEPEVAALFKTKHILKFRCQNCQLEEERSSENVILTVPKIPEKFSILNISFRICCLHCKDATQERSIQFERLPVNLMVHFVEGISCSNLLSYNFEHMGFQYIISGIIQYKRNPNHYVVWIYNIEEKFWLEFDDLKSTPKVHHIDYPVFPLQQYHILLWEKIFGDRKSTSWPSLLKLHSQKEIEGNLMCKPSKTSLAENLIESQILNNVDCNFIESLSSEEKCKVSEVPFSDCLKECDKSTEKSAVISLESVNENVHGDEHEIHKGTPVENICSLSVESSAKESVEIELHPEKKAGCQMTNVKVSTELGKESTIVNEKLMVKEIIEKPNPSSEKDSSFLGLQSIINKDNGKTHRIVKLCSVENIQETPWLLSPPASETISDSDSLEIHELQQLSHLQDTSFASDNTAQSNMKLSSDVIPPLKHSKFSNVVDVQKCSPILLLPQTDLTSGGQNQISILKLSSYSVTQLLNVVSSDITTIIVPQHSDPTINATIFDKVMDIVKNSFSGSQQTTDKDRKSGPKTDTSSAMEKCGNWINQSAAQFVSQNVDTCSAVDQEVSNDSIVSAFSCMNSSHFSDKAVNQYPPNIVKFSGSMKKIPPSQTTKNTFLGYDTNQTANATSNTLSNRVQKVPGKKQNSTKNTKTLNLKGVDKTLLFHAKNRHLINNLTSTLDFSETVAKASGRVNNMKRKTDSVGSANVCKRSRVSSGSIICNPAFSSTLNACKTVSKTSIESAKFLLENRSQSSFAFEGYKVAQLSEAQSSVKNSDFSTQNLHSNSLQR